jgi:GMP synthase-like glutamine amidotransferase
MKKVLILNLCDKSDTLHVLEFVRPVELIVKKYTLNYEIKHYTEAIVYSDFTHIILCGVSLRDFGYEKDLELFHWIKNYNGKLFGICAGAQIITTIYENTLIQKQQLGLQKISKINDNDILLDLTFPLEIYGLHNKSFGTINGFDELLKGEMPQLIKVSNKEHFACLFHPEVRNHKLIENFINL